MVWPSPAPSLLLLLSRSTGPYQADANLLTVDKRLERVAVDDPNEAANVDGTAAGRRRSARLDAPGAGARWHQHGHEIQAGHSQKE